MAAECCTLAFPGASQFLRVHWHQQVQLVSPCGEDLQSLDSTYSSHTNKPAKTQRLAPLADSIHGGAGWRGVPSRLPFLVVRFWAPHPVTLAWFLLCCAVPSILHGRQALAVCDRSPSTRNAVYLV